MAFGPKMNDDGVRLQIAMGERGFWDGQPLLLKSEREMYDAFWDLSTCRNVGMSSGPIPFVALDQYATRFDIRGDDFDRLHFLIYHLDAIWMKHHEKKNQPIDSKGSEDS